MELSTTMVQAVQRAEEYYDHRYQMTEHYRTAWKSICVEVELTGAGGRPIYRCRMESDIQRGCLGGMKSGQVLDVQIDAESGVVVGFSETGWGKRR